MKRMNVSEALACCATVATTAVRVRLREHYLAGWMFDESAKQTRALCACSRLDLGWHASVAAAVEAWIDHVVGGEK